MSMNKKEQAAMEALQAEVIRLKAWKLTDKVEPDVPPPERGSKSGALSKGYLFNGGSWPRVERACSSSVHHSFGQDDHTTTQQPRALYSSRERAWRAMRYEKEQEFLKALCKIDAEIANCSSSD